MCDHEHCERCGDSNKARDYQHKKLGSIVLCRSCYFVLLDLGNLI